MENNTVKIFLITGFCSENILGNRVLDLLCLLWKGRPREVIDMFADKVRLISHIGRLCLYFIIVKL